jgi:hypothetical protein
MGGSGHGTAISEHRRIGTREKNCAVSQVSIKAFTHETTPKNGHQSPDLGELRRKVSCEHNGH